MLYHIQTCNYFNDHRGDLVQFLTKEWLVENRLDFGQIYVLTFSQVGVIRGNHYHKRSAEVFCIIKGEAQIFLKSSITGEEASFVLKCENSNYRLVTVPALVAHAIKSMAPDTLVVSFASESYNPDNEDKHPLILV